MLNSAFFYSNFWHSCKPSIVLFRLRRAGPPTVLVVLGMEIYSKNGDCKAKSQFCVEAKDSSSKKRYKAPLPPIAELPSSTLPSNKGLARWSSTPVIHKDFSESTFPLFRKTSEFGNFGRKSFLRSTEHILATFYGLIFVIEGAEWQSLKSEYLPIYFVRISVKNVKYPFRILVIDNESDNHIRVVDFVVNCKTKTSIKEDTVCWQDQEKFGVKFTNKLDAFQFYDTISRMASTLRKGNELESQNLDQIVELEIHLPNSQKRNYSFSKNETLRRALKIVCTTEKLSVNEYYFHHMQRTDDSLDMAFKVGDLRTDKIRLKSKRELRGSSNGAPDQVSISSTSKKNRGFFSLFRRRFSRKRKEAPQYSSAPSVIQYTDNVFMVERQSGDQIHDEIHVRGNTSGTHSLARPVKSDPSNTGKTPTTLPTRNVKRKAPQPPKLIIPKPGEAASKVNGHHTIDGKKTNKKRRAPSPPRNATMPVNGSTSPNQYGTNPLSPPTPPSVNGSIETSDNAEHKSRLPVFIAPPPPESTPPPFDECETPIGPIDSELDDGSVEIPVEINGVVDDTKSLDSKSSENREDLSSVPEERSEDVEIKVQLDVKDGAQNNENENKDGLDKIDKHDEEEEKPANDQPEIAEDKVDSDKMVKKDENGTINSKNENILSKVDENDNSLNRENMTPEQLQALLTKTPQSQDPLNLQNQQLFAMQQNQQMLSNILLQQMLQQQMTQQRQPNIMPVAGVMPVPLQLAGGVNPMQPGGVMSPVGTIPGMQPQMNGTNYHNPMWPHAQPLPQPLQQQVTPPPDTKASEEVKTSTSSENIPKEVKSESGSQTETPKPPPPLKDEELVNRPLFKKMLAQVSQGKLQGVPPKLATQKSQESEVTPTSPLSPAAKITKVPTSYVASAEKNVPQSKPEEERKAPITLDEVGRKSSYVDSAVGKKKDEEITQNDGKAITKISENSIVTISETPAKVVNVDSAVTTSSTASKPDAIIDKTSEKATTETNSDKKLTVAVSDSENKRQVTPIVTNNNPPITSKPFRPNMGVAVANHIPANEMKPLVNQNATSGAIVVNTHSTKPKTQSAYTPNPNVSAPNLAAVNHNSATLPSKISPQTTTPASFTSVAQQAAKVAAEKQNSQVSKPSLHVGHTPHKLKIEEPVLGTYKYQRTVVPPLSPPTYTGKTSTGLSQNGGQVSFGYATTGRMKTSGSKPPPVAQKPRHSSESRPAVAAKPAYDIGQSKTLPKSKKSRHIQISLSLTPEERMQLPSKSAEMATNL